MKGWSGLLSGSAGEATEKRRGNGKATRGWLARLRASGDAGRIKFLNLILKKQKNLKN